jgi:hypothetical protein
MPAVANKRLANKVIAGLEDIMALSLHSLRVWEKAKDRAQLKCADPAQQTALRKGNPNGRKMDCRSTRRASGAILVCRCI